MHKSAQKKPAVDLVETDIHNSLHNVKESRNDENQTVSTKVKGDRGGRWKIRTFAMNAAQV